MEKVNHEEVRTFHVKGLQAPQKRRVNGRLALGFGEASFYDRRIRNATDGRVGLGNVIMNHGEVVLNHQAVRGHEFMIDPREEYDAFVVFPVRDAPMVNEFNEELFATFFADWLTQVEQDLSKNNVRYKLTMSIPGAVDGPDQDEQTRRWDLVEALIEEHAPNTVEADFRWSAMELPQYSTLSEELKQEMRDIKFQPGDLYFVGARSLESSSELRRHGLSQIAEAMLKNAPKRVIAPVSVGLNLALLEAAVKQGIPTVAVWYSSVDDWAPANVARLETVLDSPHVTQIGQPQYVANRMGDVVAFLSEQASIGKADQVRAANPRNMQEVSQSRGTDMWNVVESILAGNKDFIGGQSRSAAFSNTDSSSDQGDLQPMVF